MYSGFSPCLIILLRSLFPSKLLNLKSEENIEKGLDGLLFILFTTNFAPEIF